MQRDMHYYGTYCMARAGGLTAEAAQLAASCAQYVDDNVSGEPVALKDGARLLRAATAHHITDVMENVDPDDQRNVWVPFHFLPGNEAEDDDADYTVRLRCRKDSEPARTMVDHVLGQAEGSTVALERLGVTAHVYADTFSHHGFSGVSSRRNMVEGGSFTFDHDDATVAKLRQAEERFFARFGAHGGLLANVKEWRAALSQRAAGLKSAVGEIGAGALGHGSVATYPDLPYLVWGFEYSHPRRRRVMRDNPADFFDACRALHAMFSRFAAIRPDFAEPGAERRFDDIDAAIRDILAHAGEAEARAQAWRDAARAGLLFATAEDIPPYLGPEWTQWLAEADGKIDSDTAMAHPACRFHMAAGAHRSYVLHQLLPERNLLVG